MRHAKRVCSIILAVLLLFQLLSIAPISVLGSYALDTAKTINTFSASNIESNPLTNFDSSSPDGSSVGGNPQIKMLNWLAKQQDNPLHHVNIQFSQHYPSDYLGEVSGNVDISKLPETTWRNHPYITMSEGYVSGIPSSISGTWVDVANPSNCKIAIYDKTDIEYFKTEVKLNSDGSWNAGKLTIRGSLVVHLMTLDGRIICSVGDKKASFNNEYEVWLYALSDIPYFQAKIPLRMDGTFVSNPIPKFNSNGDIVGYYPTMRFGTKVARLVKIENGEILSSTESPAYKLIRSYEVPSDDPYRTCNIDRKSWIYDNALAVIAFSMAGNQQRASQILSSLRSLQDADGSLEFVYDVYTGKLGTAKRSGAIAWVGYAAVFYEKRFNDSSYRTFAKKIANYLLTLQNQSTGSFKGGPDVRWYSTEHNIDCYFFIRDLYELVKEPKYFDSARAVRASLIQNHWNENKKRFNQGVGDDAFALDANSWGGIFAYAIGDRSKALAALRTTNLFYVSGQTMPYSNDANTYNTSFISNELLSGYKPYVKDASYPDAPDIIWTEGTWGVISLGMRLSQDVGHLIQSMLNIQSANANGAVVYSNKSFAATPYEMHVWPAVAGTAWGYMILNNNQSFWSVDSDAFKQEIAIREAQELAYNINY